MGYAAQVNSSFSGWPDLARADSCEWTNVAKATRAARAVRAGHVAGLVRLESAAQQRRLALVQPSLALQGVLHPSHSSALLGQTQSTSAASLTTSDVFSHEAGSLEQYLWCAAWFLLGFLFLCST